MTAPARAAAPVPAARAGGRDDWPERFAAAYGGSYAALAADRGHPVSLPGVRGVDLCRPASFLSGLVLTRDPGEHWEPLLDEVEELVDPHGPGELHLFSAWASPVPQRRGWHLHGHPPLLVRPVATPLPAPRPGGDVVVEEVVDAAGLEEWVRVLVEAYPMTELQGRPPADVLSHRALSSGMRFWTARRDGEVAGVGSSWSGEGVHVLVLGAVLPRHRGTGVWTALLRARLTAFPGLPTAAVFSDLSTPRALHHGFRPVRRFTLWSRLRPG